MREGFDLAVRPTPEQVRRFRALDESERYAWLASMLQTMHSLATIETKAQWRMMKEARSGGFLSTACAFARAIDRANFDLGADCLSKDCRYESVTLALTGPERIITSYREAHDWALRKFDRIRYRSRVLGIGAGVASISFDTLVDHRGVSYVYRWAQEVSIGRSRLIERIVHCELDGERAAFDAFLARAAITR